MARTRLRLFPVPWSECVHMLRHVELKTGSMTGPNLGESLGKTARLPRAQSKAATWGMQKVAPLAALRLCQGIRGISGRSCASGNRELAALRMGVARSRSAGYRGPEGTNRPSQQRALAAVAAGYHSKRNWSELNFHQFTSCLPAVFSWKVSSCGASFTGVPSLHTAQTEPCGYLPRIPPTPHIPGSLRWGNTHVYALGQPSALL
jgi:hypothetical protein